MAITKARAIQLEDFTVTSGEFTGTGTVASPFALGTVPVTKGGTGATANTGTGSNVLATSPSLVTPVLGAASGTSLNLSSLTATTTLGADASKNIVSITNTGTGNAVRATSPTLSNPVVGTQTAGNNSTLAASTAFVQNAITAPVVDIVNTTVVNLVSGTKYYANHAGLSTGLLPTTAAKGSQILMRGQGTGGWKITQNANQKIHGASDSTSGTAGFLASQTQYDTVVLECMVANLEWIIVANRGTLTIT